MWGHEETSNKAIFIRYMLIVDNPNGPKKESLHFSRCFKYI